MANYIGSRSKFPLASATRALTLVGAALAGAKDDSTVMQRLTTVLPEVLAERLEDGS